MLEEGRRQKFPMTRLVANMEWALEDRPGVGDIVEYESRLNYVLPQYDDTVVCTYDLGKFSAIAVMDILRTHPMVVIGEVMQENPFCVLRTCCCCTTRSTRNSSAWGCGRAPAPAGLRLPGGLAGRAARGGPARLGIGGDRGMVHRPGF